MAATVKLPKWGLTMEEATINEWAVAVGEHVEQGATLATVESEKVEIDLPSPVSGIVAEHLVAEGDTVRVGASVAVIAVDLADYRRWQEKGAS